MSADRIADIHNPRRGDRQANGSRAAGDTEREGDARSSDTADARALKSAIGRQIREIRRQLDLTIVELCKLADISPGMLSRVENGSISPSLATLQVLARALNVPLTSFFRKFEAQRDVSYVPAGDGVVLERQGPRAGRECRLLGQIWSTSITVEPYLITLTDDAQIYRGAQLPGTAFLHILEGRIAYRHAGKVYTLQAGDSLMFDSDAPHGPEKLLKPPIRFLSINIRGHDK